VCDYTAAENYFCTTMQRRLPSREYELLLAIRKSLGRAAAAAPLYECALGDDAAIRRERANGRMILTTDIAVENVHFSRAYMTMAEIGFMVIATNVSDCAAMAARPESALVQLVFPAGEGQITKKAVDLYKGISEACRRWTVSVIGGDLARGNSWTIGISMIGVAPSKARLLLRKGVRPGDALWLSGFPGRSAAGLAALRKWGRKNVPERYRGLVECHLRPEPSPELGLALGKCRFVHAMMDLSDGISKDARTLCHENMLGLDLSLDGLRPPEAMAALGREIGAPWQEWALHGGEEYTLLFAAGPEFGPEILPPRFRRSLVRLGAFTARHRDLVVLKNGKRIPVPRGSWDHVR
jgi:thiamine-monophosphate kinase